MKLDEYSKYHPREVALAESAFLTAWAGLGAWHEDMVLVGGLVPKYLCGDTSASLDTLRHYDGGTEVAIHAFAEEARLNNPAMPDALRCLQMHFTTENASAPVRAAHFICGQRTADEPTDVAFQRSRVQQDMVDAGQLLIRALNL